MKVPMKVVCRLAEFSLLLVVGLSVTGCGAKVGIFSSDRTVQPSSTTSTPATVDATTSVKLSLPETTALPDPPTTTIAVAAPTTQTTLDIATTQATGVADACLAWPVRPSDFSPRRAAVLAAGSLGFSFATEQWDRYWS